MTAIKTPVPIISFTFDDAPRTAFNTAGDILKTHSAMATFFVSLGLLGLETEVGRIASRDDLMRAIQYGDELGCHTFDHFDTWKTSTNKFVESVVKNKEALDRLLPGTIFRTFAYPINEPKPAVKSRLERYFICCRGGGQLTNVGMSDFNLLKAYFLDRRNNLDINTVRKMIDYNTSSKGWLIFATHDVADSPSRYGCTPKFFREVVEHTARSGALILPVGKAYDKILDTNSERIILKGDISLWPVECQRLFRMSFFSMILCLFSDGYIDMLNGRK
jgi:peptidoglycan/xylan/chitin deacetylase (PgdA/CDA1 family)